MPRLYEWSLPPASPFELAQLDYYKGQCQSKFLRLATAGLSELLTCHPAGTFRAGQDSIITLDQQQKLHRKMSTKKRKTAGFQLVYSQRSKVPNKAQAAQRTR